eukprot:TRINITY_DN3908_c0_g1_i1.p1 TRINITY_DN3908_c0_g1~~TRINITY_DN3908_c0_g1_i1.p1  ORF type:complete len:85 (-),score=20.82 TRINITY_DN3908_c0_g1_i1:28-282(-)
MGIRIRGAAANAATLLRKETEQSKRNAETDAKANRLVPQPPPRDKGGNRPKSNYRRRLENVQFQENKTKTKKEKSNRTRRRPLV